MFNPLNCKICKKKISDINSAIQIDSEDILCSEKCLDVYSDHAEQDMQGADFHASELDEIGDLPIESDLDM